LVDIRRVTDLGYLTGDILRLLAEIWGFGAQNLAQGSKAEAQMQMIAGGGCVRLIPSGF